MSIIAILIGVYSLCILFLGILGLLDKLYLGLTTVIFIISLLMVLKRIIIIDKITVWVKKRDIFEKCLLILIIILAFINFIGVLGPETSFDALWYHLTVPKIYIQGSSIFYIPGNLLYYSAMPKLGDLLYIPALMFGNEITAKFIHFIFGLLCCFVIYTFARMYVGVRYSLIAVLIFYSNVVVAWESTVAYVDLIWAFFVILSVYKLFQYFNSNKLRYFVLSAVFLGFSVGVKVISLRDLLITSILIIMIYFLKNRKFDQAIIKIFQYSLIVLAVSLPWFVFSYVNTGNPLFPFFTSIYSLKDPNLLNMGNVINEYITLFLRAPDPISPIYVIFIPIIVVCIRQSKIQVQHLFIYSTLSLLVWYATYQSGAEGRYAIPYLGVLSVLCVSFIDKVGKKTEKFLIICIVLVAILTVSYRGIANSRYLPVILGSESKGEYLTRELNYQYGDFYDTDGFLEKEIKDNEMVLIYGIHNLYYVNFNFIDSTWRKKRDKFDYVLVRGEVPEEFINWRKVYENKISNVKLYKP